MTGSIEIVDHFDDPARWDAFVEAQPSGHFFQCWTWGEMQRGLAARPRRIAAVSNGQIRGAVQMLVFEGATRPFAVVPRGPVADPADAAVVEALTTALLDAGRAEGTFLLRIEPQWTWDAAHAERLRAHGFASATQWIMPRRTLLVDLRPSVDEIWAGFKSNTRNRVRLAEKLGVEVRVGTDADMPIFEALFEEMTVRHGLRRAARETFDLAAKAFAGTGMMRLYLARSRGDGIDVSGIVVFVFGRTATYLWGASSDAEAARKLNPNQLLHWTAMQWAKSRGCDTYDTFGIPDHDVDVLEAEYGRQTGGMWSLYRFKRGFGGTVVRQLGTFDHVYR
jgi:peptidoglycan pentaglycine glycine transferase (the first glycine)